MAKPYDNDLCQKVIQAIEQDGLAQWDEIGWTERTD